MTINVEIVPKKGELFEKTIKRFMKKVKKEGILEEWRDKYMYYVKPSVKRRRKKMQRKRTMQKIQKKYNNN